MARKKAATELTEQQETALTLLLEGKGQVEAAAQMEVTEVQVSQWMAGDVSFVAEWNRRRQARWEANAQRLRGLAARALDTLEDLLESDNEEVRHRTAATILKAAKLAELGRPEGPTTPHAVERQQDLLFDLW